MINKGLLQRIAALSFLRAAGYDGTEYRVQMNNDMYIPGDWTACWPVPASRA